MINKDNILHIKKVLDNEISNNIKNRELLRTKKVEDDTFIRVCQIRGELDVLIKLLKNGDRNTKSN